MKIKRTALLLFFVSAIFFVAAGHTNSLWTDGSPSPYSSQKIYKHGDIVTILIIESTSAGQNAATNTAKSDNLSANFTHTIQQLNSLISPNTSVTGAASNNYAGTGSTTRSSNVMAAVAATVTAVLPNGNLEVEGKHKVSVNDEMQTIVITGTVRPQDVTSSNTVYSYQVSDANISVKGQGAIGAVAAPGWMTKFINWLF